LGGLLAGDRSQNKLTDGLLMKIGGMVHGSKNTMLAYVTGAYMGLGENRHSRQGIEIESTFGMLKIRQLMEG
jgi:hypothetical protein